MEEMHLRKDLNEDSIVISSKRLVRKEFTAEKNSFCLFITVTF